MAKYEPEDFETFIRETKLDKVNKVGIKSLYEYKEGKPTIKNNELIQTTNVRASIILTAINEQEYYAYQELVTNGVLTSEEDIKELEATTQKRIDEIIDLLQKQIPEAHLFKGRIVP